MSHDCIVIFDKKKIETPTDTGGVNQKLLSVERNEIY